MNPTMELPPKEQPDISQMSYEQALAELEQIVTELEGTTEGASNHW
jgi:hypothetical protein